MENQLHARISARARRRGGIALWRPAALIRILLAAAVLLAALGVVVGVVAARPHLSSVLRQSDNRLTITLAVGRGPLAGWLLSRSSIALGSQHGSRIVVTVRPGRTTVLHPVVDSVWSTSEPLSVSAPEAPALVDSTVSATTLTLRFSMPVAVHALPCGLQPSATRSATVSLPRGAATCSGAVETVADSGERSAITLSIPALPPPPPPPPAPPPPPPAQPPPEVFTASGAGGAFYITIDDGWYPNNDVLNLMRSDHLPITAFLTSQAAGLHLDYWRAFIAAGGDIEDHSVTHPYMTKMSATAVENEWTVAAQSFKSWFGAAPTMGRPPYGDVNATVIAAAGHAGLRRVVMWTAYVQKGILTTQDKGPLRAGEIVLLHWTPDVYTDLQRLLGLAAAQGLHPASLSAALG